MDEASSARLINTVSIKDFSGVSMTNRGHGERTMFDAQPRKLALNPGSRDAAFIALLQ